MGAAFGLRDDIIDEAEFLKIDGGYAEGLGGLGGESAVFPKNASASFGRDDRVVAVFQDENTIGHTDA